MTEEKRTCARCVMDTSATGIEFDASGNCNYCSEFLARSHRVLFATPEERESERAQLVERIKRAGHGKRYDCIVGLSGGVDSSWALHLAVEQGLRPLAVHMDNGWNSELAQHNIEQLVKRMGVDLYTHVIDWPEYRKLMQAFFDADVVDVELLYDNALAAVNFEQAARNGLRFILSGQNQSTEGMLMPEGWNWFKNDRRNILAIWRRFGEGTRLRTFPMFSTLRYVYHFVKGVRWTPFLDYFEYNKPRALEVLKERFDYKPYPYKHYESVFTRFYQGYILPKKCGIDKRRLHLSTLVVTGQMTREEAVADLARLPYPSDEALQQDIAYFLKKMGWTREQLDAYLARPRKPHDSYPTERPLWQMLATIGRKLGADAR